MGIVARESGKRENKIGIEKIVVNKIVISKKTANILN